MVTVGLEAKGNALLVTIADNGSGIDGHPTGRRPRSISERIAQLGGVLAIETGAGGTTLRFRLPLEASR
jgi:signal transduction histidine kinase